MRVFSLSARSGSEREIGSQVGVGVCVCICAYVLCVGRWVGVWVCGMGGCGWMGRCMGEL